MGRRLSEEHLLPSKLQRYKRGVTSQERAQNVSFNQTDDILDSVYVDICNGVARSDVIQKLMKGLYEGQTGRRSKLQYRTANEYYNTALDRMHFNTDIEHQRLKDVFYNRYESLLETAIKKGDIYNAKGILDSMSRIFLGVDKPSTAIQINSDKENGITVNFGFNNEVENEE